MSVHYKTWFENHKKLQMRKLRKKANMQGTAKLCSYQRGHPSVFDVVLLTTNAGSTTVILQLLQVNPPEAFKPLPQPGCLGAAAHASQLVRESDAWVFFPLLHNSDCRRAAEWSKQKASLLLASFCNQRFSPCFRKASLSKTFPWPGCHGWSRGGSLRVKLPIP